MMTLARIRALLGLAVLSSIATAVPAASRPNVVLFLADDLAADPGEDKNLAAENPAMAVELRNEYNAWLDQIAANALWEKSSPSKYQQGEE